MQHLVRSTEKERMPVKLNIISCSLHGYQLAKRIEHMLASRVVVRDTLFGVRTSTQGVADSDQTYEVTTRVKAKDCENLTTDYLREQSISEYVASIFDETDAILFVCSVGIAVRMIAPYIKHKSTDPAVLVMDETGKFCIPILSGHYGGANDLADKLSKMTGAEAVITTATDREGHFAVDVFARKNHLVVKDWVKAKQYSAEILGENQMKLSITVSPYMNDNPNTVWLVPKCIIVGIGCKQGTDKSRIEEAVTKTLAKYKISPDAVKMVASIDLKKNEPGLIKYCSEHQLLFSTFSAEQLRRVSGSTSSSEFVREVTGVDNVCERSALAAGGELICPKTVYAGVTVALTQDEIVLNW